MAPTPTDGTDISAAEQSKENEELWSKLEDAEKAEMMAWTYETWKERAYCQLENELEVSGVMMEIAAMHEGWLQKWAVKDQFNSEATEAKKRCRLNTLGGFSAEGGLEGAVKKGDDEGMEMKEGRKGDERRKE